MTANYVLLTVDEADGAGNPVTTGTATFTPSVALTDPTDQMNVIGPVTVHFRAGIFPVAKLLATDNAGPQPSGWGWTVTFSGVPGNPASFSFFLPFTGGSSQRLSAQTPVLTATTMAAYMPLPSGTPTAGQVPVATGTGEASAWGAGGGSVSSVFGRSGAVTAQSGDYTAAQVGAVAVTGGGKETISALGSITGATTVNLANGNVFTGTQAGNVTLTLSGATNGVACTAELRFTQDATGGRTVTFPGSVSWAGGGSAPSPNSAPSAVNTWFLQTLDGGTTWLGSLAAPAPVLPLTVANGGTGGSSMAAYELVTGGVTSTSPVQAVASSGTVGNFLLDEGSSAVPAFGQPPLIAPTGLTGATAASRYAGATASGAPASGTFAVGDYVIDRTGKIWICTTAGSPGTWSQVGGSGGNFLAVIPATGVAATDTAALQTALTAARTAGGGVVRGVPGGAFVTNAYLVIGSGTTLDLTGCSLTLSGSADGAILRNYSMVNAAASASDAAISSGGSVITTSLGASAVVGQSVVVAGAAGAPSAGAMPFTGLVSAKTSTTITVTNLDGTTLTATNTVSSAAVSLYNRDSNITVLGGPFNAGTYGGNGTSNHKIYLSHIDHYVIDTYGVSATTGVGYLHLVADGTDGWIRARGMSSTTTGQDGVHVNGPHYGLIVEQSTGVIGDDGLSLTANNYPQAADTAGNIIGVYVGTVNVSTPERTMICIAGTGTVVDHVKVFGGLRGKAAYVHVGDDTNQASTQGGTYGDIDLGKVSVITTNYAVGLYSPSATRIRVELDYVAGTAPPIGVETLAGGGTQTIQELVVTGSWTGDGSAKVVYHNSSSVVLGYVLVDGFSWVNSATGSGGLVWLQGSVSATQVDIVNCLQSYPNTSNDYAVVINSAGSSISQLNFIGGETVKGYCLIGDNSTASMVTTFSGGFTVGGRQAVVQMGGTAAGTKTYNFAGCQFQNISGAAFQAAGTASIVFNGNLYETAGSFTLSSNSGSGTVTQTALPIGLGGTGQVTQQTAIDALTGTQTAATYLRSDGTHATLQALQAGDLAIAQLTQRIFCV